MAWTIIVGTMFGRLVTSMSIPFLAIYLTGTLGVSSVQTGLIVAASSLAGVSISFYGGYISDRIGRKKVMLVSVFCWAAVFFGFAAASEIWMFFVVNVLNGLCRSVFEPASRALLSDTTPPERKLLVFNLRYAAINIGVVFGPILGLRLGSAQSTAPFAVAGVVYILYGLVLVAQFAAHRSVLQTAKNAAAPKIREAFAVTGRDRIFLPVLIGTTFCVMGYGHFSSTLAQYLTLTPRIANGRELFSYMLAMNAAVVLIVQYPVVKTVSRFRPVVPLILGCALVSVSLLLFGLAQGIAMFLVGVFIFTVGEVLMFTMMDVLIDRIAPEAWKGTYFGTIGFNNLGSVAAPVVGGLLLDRFALQSGFAVFAPLALITLCGLPFLLAAHRRLTHRERAEGAAAVQAAKNVL
ncbi:MFS transporter [Saccharibacillus sp. CPCC 101409]|uniref:MDR family MFS transporter n=1 Tax=Saccharibacillus sp. CPCC 101409 TaxID=3058041 RepID=UPI002671A3A1|nr:MFS transporter [Saccharibacillus sp. CPCC 101409]MDO3412188.1 MFS transporter [Saccharibacillus sp. CPCC 101409]